ncbi:hypothetical protein ACTHS7_08960 [Neisseria sp. P0015.S009]
MCCWVGRRWIAPVGMGGIVADWFIFRYGLKVAGRLKADVSDGLDVVM